MLRKTLIIGALLVAVAAAGVAYAAIPSSDGTISACKDNKGALKVIGAEAGQTCPGSQQLLNWNQQGPPGPQGPAGVSGYEVVSESSGVAFASLLIKTVLCPTGKVPLGGGAWATNSDDNVINDAALAMSRPTSTGWQAEAFVIGGTPLPFQLHVYAICAAVQP
jgi:hypothetical protein